VTAVTVAQRLAAFAVRASYDDLTPTARTQLKMRVLDSLGCAIGAIGAGPPHRVRAVVEELDEAGRCSLIGGGRASPDRATFYNGTLIRYLDYNDSYLAPGESCHPSDNLSAVLAAAEYAGAGGRDLIAALAVAYQVQCRLSDEAPVRARGFDHTTQGAYAVAAGASRALHLDVEAAANAIAISGTALNALRVTRTGVLSQWKGLAFPNMAAGGVRAVLLARRGITAPLDVVEGHKGFMDVIAGKFDIDWEREDLERVTRTIVKRHNAEIHAQTSIDAALALRRDFQFSGNDVNRVDVDTFDVAYTIIGGEEGDKTYVRTKEQADHSLPYLIAVAILDGEVTPAQYEPERILRSDVQQLLRRVSVHAASAYSQRFPREMPSRVTIRLNDGRTLSREATEYPGLNGPPATWEDVSGKFRRLSGGRLRIDDCDAIVDVVQDLERHPLSRLTRLLTAVRIPAGARTSDSRTLEESSHGSHA